jgi:hypothetical protein
MRPAMESEVVQPESQKVQRSSCRLEISKMRHQDEMIIASARSRELEVCADLASYSGKYPTPNTPREEVLSARSSFLDRDFNPSRRSIDGRASRVNGAICNTEILASCHLKFG